MDGIAMQDVFIARDGGVNVMGWSVDESEAKEIAGAGGSIEACSIPAGSHVERLGDVKFFPASKVRGYAFGTDKCKQEMRRMGIKEGDLV
jgi:hypothetical protein